MLYKWVIITMEDLKKGEIPHVFKKKDVKMGWGGVQTKTLC